MTDASTGSSTPVDAPRNAITRGAAEIEEHLESAWGHRHMGTQHFKAVLRPNPNLPEHLREISTAFWLLACGLLDMVGDGPELTAALRKIREAKDCAVMQAVLDRG